MLETLTPNLPTAEELAHAEAEHTRLSETQTALTAKIRAVEGEIARLEIQATAEPDMAALTELAEVESLSRITGHPLPKGHQTKLLEARQAALSARIQADEARALLPRLQAHLASLKAEYEAGRHAALKAAEHFGTLTAAPLLVQYFEHVERAMEVERRLAEINETLGHHWHAELSFRHPTGGDKFTRRDVAAMETSA